MPVPVPMSARRDHSDGHVRDQEGTPRPRHAGGRSADRGNAGRYRDTGDAVSVAPRTLSFRAPNATGRTTNVAEPNSVVLLGLTALGLLGLRRMKSAGQLGESPDTTLHHRQAVKKIP